MDPARTCRCKFIMQKLTAKDGEKAQRAAEFIQLIQNSKCKVKMQIGRIRIADGLSIVKLSNQHIAELPNCRISTLPNFQINMQYPLPLPSTMFPLSFHRGRRLHPCPRPTLSLSCLLSFAQIALSSAYWH